MIEFTNDELELIEGAIEYNNESRKPVKGPASLRDAIHRYSNSFTHYCMSSVKEHDDLADKCYCLTMAQFKEQFKAEGNGESELPPTHCSVV